MKVINPKMNQAKFREGNTLVELLLYMAILSLIILAVSSMVYLTFQSRIKSQVIAEVEQQGNQTMEIILRTIRNSSSVNTPTTGASGNTLSLATYSAPTSPSVFSINNGALTIKEGSAGTINLTSDKLMIDNLLFTNLSYPQTPGNVKIEFTLQYKNNDNISEYNYKKTFYSTASLRWP